MYVFVRRPFEAHAGETDTPPYHVQNGILHKLKELGALELHNIHHKDILDELALPPDDDFDLSPGEYVSVLPIEPRFSELCREYEHKMIADRKVATNTQCWISRDGPESFLYNERKVFVKNRQAQYARIFDVVFDLVPQGGGITYKKIIEQCKVHGLRTTRRAIQKALSGKSADLYRYVKDIPARAPDGVPFFVAQKNGKTLVFNNRR